MQAYARQRAEKLYNDGYRAYKRTYNEKPWVMVYCGKDLWTTAAMTDKACIKQCGYDPNVWEAFKELYGRTQDEFEKLRGDIPAKWNDLDLENFIKYGRI